MAYTIVKSDGTVLTTIADGTINTTSTSLGLVGRNFAGWGKPFDTNFVHILENFADSSPPSNPLRGQLWYNTNNQTLYVCPINGETNSANWLALTSTSSAGSTTFGNVTVTGDLQANNITAVNNINGANGVFTNISVSANANITTGNLTTAAIGSLTTTVITTGSSITQGTLTGTWVVSGGGGGNTMIVNDGNIYATVGIRCDNYFYANGAPISFAGTYNDSNVRALLPIYAGNLLAANVTTTMISTGANTTSGTITGNWTLTTGSRLLATYADLAERFEADDIYEPGTVVELGGDKEITSVKYELSEDIFGVISDSAAYLMNSAAGSDSTHPPVAMTGRVQVKVSGIVKKGDRLVSAGNGIARAATTGEITAFNVIGRALENKTTTSIGTVLAIVTVSK